MPASNEYLERIVGALMAEVAELRSEMGQSDDIVGAATDAAERSPIEQDHLAPRYSFSFAGWRRDSAGLITGVRVFIGNWRRALTDDRPNAKGGQTLYPSPSDSGQDYFTVALTGGNFQVFANLKWSDATDYASDPVTISDTPGANDFWHWAVPLFSGSVSGADGALDAPEHVGDIETMEYYLGVGSANWGCAAPKTLELDGTTLNLMGYSYLWLRPGGIKYGNAAADFDEGAADADFMVLSSVELGGICSG